MLLTRDALARKPGFLRLRRNDVGSERHDHVSRSLSDFSQTHNHLINLFVIVEAPAPHRQE
jgi:hypothetical protein